MKRFLLMLTMLFSVCAFTSCSDDDDNNEQPEPQCPVTNISLNKTRAVPGEQITMSGEGFTANAKLYLKGDTEIALSDVVISNDGTSVTFTVPEIEKGTYTFVLVQEGSWTLTATLTVVIKQLDTFTLNVAPPYDFKLYYNTEGKADSITQTVTGSNPYRFASFTYGNDTIYMKMNTNGGMDRNQGYFVYEGQQIKSCNGQNWTYGTDGYLTGAITGTNPVFADTKSYTYTNGNLTNWSDTYMNNTITLTLDYSGERPSVKGMDVAALCANILGGGVSSSNLVFHLLDLSGKQSKQLPATITDDAAKSATITDYTVDEDGFITRVVLNDQLRFNKELILTFSWK